MARLLILLVLLLPLIEIALFVVIGRAIGVWPTLLAVVVAAFAGVLILRLQGLTLFARMREASQSGVLPARTLADGMMIGVAGVLLLVPGFFSDLIGLLLLLPPVRGLLYRLLRSRIRVVATGSTGAAGVPPEPRRLDLDDSEWRER